MTDNQKMVMFDEYCPTCKNFDVPEEDDPCDECLRSPFKENSEKPVKWEDKNE